ncbi:hypothetical protein I6N90_13590 [Paenibacillus sp. GSMTC-2017]|uniref:hypothetical protein n=1 Tax=Paenibacillus sp. GSMTC-2017 TaxID=2794350 RepID=UPI0018D6FCEE|nr:hypothetical protein [Paenibacillus sp. GSMTC-2017]MBH5318832.1 hypothetical protein [Paenibacillus sp. GSMTC-2017]
MKRLLYLKLERRDDVIIINSSNRHDYKWLSNIEGHTTRLKIEDESYSICDAYLIWSSDDSEQEVTLKTENAEAKVNSTKGYESKQAGQYAHIKNVLAFVRDHSNETYVLDIHTRWHLIVVYSSPFLSVSHVSLYIPKLFEQGQRDVWKPWLKSLPINHLDLPWSANVHVLGADLNSIDMDTNLILEENSIHERNYETIQNQFPSPIIIAQKINLPETKMRLEHTVDIEKIKVGDIVTITTKITNVSKVIAGPVQYRSTLPQRTTLLPNSFSLNRTAIPMGVDGFNCITVYLRHMPEGDVIIVVYKIYIQAESSTELFTSSTLDYNFSPALNNWLVGNQPSNIVKLTFLDG